uniref:Uncharacterized protein n=1 Tax=Plectus sambesii TaxID=2011161 RepID=A0A914WI39_9BILA
MSRPSPMSGFVPNTYSYEKADQKLWQMILARPPPSVRRVQRELDGALRDVELEDSRENRKRLTDVRRRLRVVILVFAQSMARMAKQSLFKRAKAIGVTRELPKITRTILDLFELLKKFGSKTSETEEFSLLSPYRADAIPALGLKCSKYADSTVLFLTTGEEKCRHCSMCALVAAFDVNCVTKLPTFAFICTREMLEIEARA